MTPGAVGVTDAQGCRSGPTEPAAEPLIIHVATTHEGVAAGHGTHAREADKQKSSKPTDLMGIAGLQTGRVETLARVTRERVVVLDGGLATELERRGHDLSDELWSARLLADDPDEILAVHHAYFAAGAEVATTASYQASIGGLTARGTDAAAMLTRSVTLARRARDEHGAGWVAASIGPYGAVLADGSEYRGDYGVTVAELRRFHRPRLEILAAAGADVLAAETMPCLAEVEAILTELDALALPAWLSLTCDGARTRAGEPAEAAFSMARECASVFAVGVNCTSPGDVHHLVELASQHSGKPVVAYPNSGEVGCRTPCLDRSTSLLPR
jgi:homocysteine S-methyltransferase